MSRVETEEALNNGAEEQQLKMQASALLSSCIEIAQPFQSGVSVEGVRFNITPYYRVPKVGSFCLVTVDSGTHISATLLLLPRGMVIDGVRYPTHVIRVYRTQDESGAVECKGAVAYAFGTKPDIPSYLQHTSTIVQAMRNYFTRQASRGKVLLAQDGPLCTVVLPPPMRQEAYMHFR